RLRHRRRAGRRAAAREGVPRLATRRALARRSPRRRRLTPRESGYCARGMIELEHVVKRYGDAVAVADVSLRVAEGELLVLLGGSGCGKTTTLKMVNRLVTPSSGRVLLGGEDVSGQPA